MKSEIEASLLVLKILQKITSIHHIIIQHPSNQKGRAFAAHLSTKKSFFFFEITNIQVIAVFAPLDILLLLRQCNITIHIVILLLLKKHQKLQQDLFYRKHYHKPSCTKNTAKTFARLLVLKPQQKLSSNLLH